MRSLSLKDKLILVGGSAFLILFYIAYKTDYSYQGVGYLIGYSFEHLSGFITSVLKPLKPQIPQTRQPSRGCFLLYSILPTQLPKFQHSQSYHLQSCHSVTLWFNFGSKKSCSPVVSFGDTL